MESYSTEMHCYKNIKTKRPSVGYNTEKERAYARWRVCYDRGGGKRRWKW